jgi:hypothetical protein
LWPPEGTRIMRWKQPTAKRWTTCSVSVSPPEFWGKPWQAPPIIDILAAIEFLDDPSGAEHMVFRLNLNSHVCIANCTVASDGPNAFQI